MTSLRETLEEYLTLRRGLGSDLHGAEARLRRFIEFLEREGASVITADLALRWATASARSCWPSATRSAPNSRRRSPPT